MGVMTEQQIATATAGAAPPESLLVSHITAHIKQAEKARERADRAYEKVTQHFIAAGQHLATLKAAYAPTWEAWETILKKVGISTGRASELMQLADGRKTVAGLRAATAGRMRALRAAPSSSQSQCDEEKSPANSRKPGTTYLLELGGSHKRVSRAEFEAAAPAQEAAADAVDAEVKAAADLIGHLAGSSPEIREWVAYALIKGTRQAEFEAVREAVADLYQQLSKAGR